MCGQILPEVCDVTRTKFAYMTSVAWCAKRVQRSWPFQARRDVADRAVTVQSAVVSQDFSWLHHSSSEPQSQLECICSFWTARGASGRDITCSAYQNEFGLELRVEYGPEELVTSELFRGSMPTSDSPRRRTCCDACCSRKGFTRSRSRRLRGSASLGLNHSLTVIRRAGLALLSCEREVV
jgi:hypothetical protein